MEQRVTVCFIFLLFVSIFSGAYVKEAHAATHVHNDDSSFFEEDLNF